MKLPRPPQAIVFDLDGTLIDSEALVHRAYVNAAPAFGIELNDDHFLSLVGLSRDANDARLRVLYGANFPLADFYAAVHGHVGETPAALKPGAIELLDKLDALDLPYALATSSQRPWVDRHFAAYGLADRFRAVITRGDVANGKPHPEPYLKAVAALGAPAKATLALEDSFAGINSAHAAGLMTVMIPDLLTADDDMRAKANLIATSLHDVTHLFDR
ncbi:MAG: HAD family phosphatase [Terricaulis sp.]